MSVDAIHDLQQETAAAWALADALRKLPDMDDDTARDTLEGATNLREKIIVAAAMLTNCEAMSVGLAVTIEQMQARQTRYEKRAAFIRAAIEQAMTIGDVRSIELPDCTLSLDRRKGGVVVTDESLIPSKFWKAQEPTLDKKAISEALKAKEAVPGATFGNGGVSLTVRRA